jgi:hypothetical protein
MSVYLRFARNPMVKWNLYKNNGAFVAENIGMLDYFEAKEYIRYGTDSIYCSNWATYLDNIYRSIKSASLQYS